jgi:hypothetical protein
MDMKITFRTILNTLVTACLLAATIHAYADEIAATPYRPSVSNPAALSVPGWLELEFGTQQIKGGDDKQRDSFPVLAKLAFNENWGILLGGEMAIQRSDTQLKFETRHPWKWKYFKEHSSNRIHI